MAVAALAAEPMAEAEAAFAAAAAMVAAVAMVAAEAMVKDLVAEDSGCAHKENRQQQRVRRGLLERCFKTCPIWEWCVNRNIVRVADG